VVSFEFSESVYTLTESQATVLAERLRNYAKGTLAEDVERVAELSGNPNWADGALAVADFTEEMLVGNISGPLPLAGKSAEATFWALRLMVDLGRSVQPADAAALRDVLSLEFAEKQPAAKRAA
jgi:hypothetical protein